MEEIASNYLEGCVNQPVQGWLEIAGYVAMYQEPFLLDRVEASKQVLARSHIVEFVTGLDEDKKPGDAVEVEFGNALMRRVHQRLLENGEIKKPWLAIPTGVAHEDIIRPKLIDEVVVEAHELIMKEVIAKTPMQLTEAFLESQLRDGWCQAIIKGSRNISAKLLEYETKYQSAKSQIEDDLEFYDYVQDRNSGSDDVEEDHQKYEERYQKEFRGLTLAEKAEKVAAGYDKLGEKRAQIDIEKDQS